MNVLNRPPWSPGAVTRVEAFEYRSLRYVSQSLAPFEVLVGPNASGKSTFLDVLAFLGDLLRAGLDGAVQGDPRLGVLHRAPDGRHLVWMRQGSRFELAVEASIPQERQAALKNGKADTCRYEIAVDVTGPLRLVAETLWLKPSEASSAQPGQRRLFPQPPSGTDSIVHPPRRHTPTGWRKILSRGEDPERVTFNAETSGWSNPFRLGADKAALMSLPEDEKKFPVATWLRQLLLEGIQRIALSSEAMRRRRARRGA